MDFFMEFLGMMLSASCIAFISAIPIWFIFALVLLKRTPKGDSVLYAKRRAQYRAATVVLIIEIVIFSMFVFIVIAAIGHM